MRFFVSLATTLTGILALLAFASCGDGGGSDDISECPEIECGTARQGYARGQLLAPNMDPIAGARVWTAQGPISNDEPDTSCFPAPGAATSSDCTSSEGVFELRCDGGDLEFQYIAGGVSGTLSFKCGDTPQKVRIRESAAESLAVVTGEFDRMQDVLAKLGFGMVGEDGRLSITTENFSLYRGGGSDDGDLANDPSLYKPAEALLTNLEEMGKYRLIFINCGEDSAESPTATERLLSRQDVRSNLRQYVNLGGKIYVTDKSYDFLEAAFPEFVDFLGDDEKRNAAEKGEARESETEPLTVDAEVHDELLADWLDLMPVNRGLVDDCSTKDSKANVNAVTGARQEDGTLLVGDFASGWAVAEGVESGKDVKVWMDGEAVFYTDDSGIPVRQNVPLVVTFEFGTNGGRVLFTSYHTSAGCSSTGFWPQERVLQYLLFAI